MTSQRTAPLQPPGDALGSAAPPSRGRRLVALIKIVVTSAACIWILSLVDWVDFWRTVRGATVWLLGIVVVMRFGGLTLSAYKWRRLLALHGADFSLGRLVRWYLVATFLNHFLPTSIGGDAYRIYRTLDNVRGRSCAVLAVIAERGTGFLALLVLGLIAGLVSVGREPDPVVKTILGICAAGLVLAAAFWVGTRVVPLRRITTRYRWARRLSSIAELIEDFRGHPRQVALIGALSFVFHVNKICAAWLVLYALGAPLDPLALTLTIAGVEVIGLLPISLGGLGVVDGSFIYLVSRFGIAPEPALAAMLLLRVLNLPLSLAGAHFYLAGGRGTVPRPSPAVDYPPNPVPHRANS